MPLHVSSTVVLIIRRSNCIIHHLVSSQSVGGRPVRRLREDSLGIILVMNQLSAQIFVYNNIIIKKEFLH